MKLIFEDMEKEIQTKSISYQFPEGSSQIRILPPWREDLTIPFKKMAYHTIGDEHVNCPKRTAQLPCPVCERVARLYKSQDPERQSLAKELKAVERFYVNAIVRTKEYDGVRKIGVGKKLIEKIVHIMKHELGKDITDPEHGHDIVIVKKLSGSYPDYSNSHPVLKESPLGNPEWLLNLPDLDKEFDLKSYDDLLSILNRYFGSVMPSLIQQPVQQSIVQEVKTPQPSTISQSSQQAKRIIDEMET
jgi:hypothetical protein